MADVYKFECKNQNPRCTKTYDFEKNAIFVWSNKICIGDEIFCQYFSCRGKRDIYFATYCYEMDEVYRDSNISSAPFVSRQTFTRCLMSWIVNQDIDFRSIDAICPQCGYEPDVLVCDGVSVGVRIRNITRLNDVTSADKHQIKPFLHRRNTRLLFSGIRILYVKLLFDKLSELLNTLLSKTT
jgi:hypothetical protein